MIAKSSLLLLSAALVSAQNQVPIPASWTCLASTSPNNCCTDSSTTDQVVIHDRTFEFTCGSKLQVMNSNNPLTVGNAHECAERCAGDPSCEASAFKAAGKLRGGKNCYFVMGDNMNQQPDGDWITFKEIVPSCLESDDPNSCCSDPATKEGEILINDERWKWTCESILTTLNFVAKDPTTVHECASLCAAEGCDGISFRKDRPRAKNCHFVRGDNKAVKPNGDFISVVKVVDDVEPPVPELDCEEDLKNTKKELEDCVKNQQGSEQLTQCEKDKSAFEKAETECQKKADQLEVKKQEWQDKYQQCDIDKTKLKHEMNTKDERIEDLEQEVEDTKEEKDGEIEALENKVTDLQDRLKGLAESYRLLKAQCEGEGPDGKCRTNIFEAEPNDDLCILDAEGKQFKIHYGRLDDAGGLSDLGSRKACSFKECAERCAKHAQCARFLWDKTGDDKSCYMRSTGKGAVPTTSSRYSSGQLL